MFCFVCRVSPAPCCWAPFLNVSVIGGMSTRNAIILIMGLIGRFTPQLDVFFLSMPIKSVVGVLFLLLYWRMLIEFFDNEFIVIIESVSELFTIL